MAGVKRLIGGASNRKQPDIDPWDAIEIFCPKTLAGGEIYLWGCALKHLIQLGSEASPLEDVKKAEQHLRKLREILEKNLTDRVTTVEDRMYKSDTELAGYRSATCSGKNPESSRED